MLTTSSHEPNEPSGCAPRMLIGSSSSHTLLGLFFLAQGGVGRGRVCVRLGVCATLDQPQNARARAHSTAHAARTHQHALPLPTHTHQHKAGRDHVNAARRRRKLDARARAGVAPRVGHKVFGRQKLLHPEVAVLEQAAQARGGKLARLLAALDGGELGRRDEARRLRRQQLERLHLLGEW